MTVFICLYHDFLSSFFSLHTHFLLWQIDDRPSSLMLSWIISFQISTKLQSLVLVLPFFFCSVSWWWLICALWSFDPLHFPILSYRILSRVVLFWCSCGSCGALCCLACDFILIFLFVLTQNGFGRWFPAPFSVVLFASSVPYSFAQIMVKYIK